jgi:hypothetical protein
VQAQLAVLVAHGRLVEVGDLWIRRLEPTEGPLDLRAILHPSAGDTAFEAAQAGFKARREAGSNRQFFVAASLDRQSTYVSVPPGIGTSWTSTSSRSFVHVPLPEVAVAGIAGPVVAVAQVASRYDPKGPDGGEGPAL